MKTPEFVIFHEYETADGLPCKRIRVGLIKKETKKGAWLVPANEALNLACTKAVKGFVSFGAFIARTTNKDLVRRTMCTLLLVDRQHEESMEGLKKAHDRAVTTTLESLRALLKESGK